MPKPVFISAKTVTLIIGVVVAIFIFLSLTVFVQGEKDSDDQSSTSQPAPTTSLVIKTIDNTSSQLLNIYNKFRKGR